ncbi:hypothetical protein ACT2FY_00845 [Paraburkholderia fungorum]|uniref:hypothetical protein n=1 Tax=Paraburkholderia fungorum TaxID=134537 RepID=UPI00402BE5D1
MTPYHVLAAMQPDTGYEAYQLARRLHVPTAQVHALIERLLVSGHLEMRRDRSRFRDCTHASYYRCESGGVSPDPQASRAAPEQRPREARADDILALMKPGLLYQAAQLASLLGVTTQRIQGLMAALLRDRRVVRRTAGGGYHHGVVFCLPDPLTDSTAPAVPAAALPPLPAPAHGKTAWESEYGRSLRAFRALCEISR